jgi:hypothetical protein
MKILALLNGAQKKPGCLELDNVGLKGPSGWAFTSIVPATLLY